MVALGEQIDAEAGVSNSKVRYTESGGRSASESEAPGE